MSEPISESLRTIHRRGVDAFGATGLAADVGPTVRRVARRRAGRVVGAGLAAVALVATVTVGALGFTGHPVLPGHASVTPHAHSDAERAEIVVYNGDTATDIAEKLAAAAVIGSAQDFVDEANKNPVDAMRIAVGGYWLPTGISASDALAAMLDPSKRQAANLTIQPGTTEEQIFRQLEGTLGIRNADFYSAAEDPASIGLPAEANGDVEGWLGAYSYHFDEGTTATEVLSSMIAATIFHLDEQGVAPADRQRVLTEASLIDMGAPFGDDRSKIARVILNRLAAGIPVDLEAGVSYRAGLDGVLTPQANRNIYSPQNTYLVPGLPPAPLWSPSAASIDAALHPADGPWLYFTTVNPSTGETGYSTTYEEHQRNLALLLAWDQANLSDLRDELGTLVGTTDAGGA
ncbi:MAG TPA: endolytic transglycosylase MltG [Demequinaceae bacterium]